MRGETKVAKRMKKVMALAAACVLSLSMGIAAFAESPVDPYIHGGSGLDKDGNKVTVGFAGKVSEEVQKILEDDEKVKDILEDAGYIPKDDQEIVVLASGNIEGDIPEGGADLELSSFAKGHGLKEGDTIYVLHQKHDGTWEVLEGKVTYTNEYGGFRVKAHFDSLSPVAFIKVMSDGKTVIMDKDGSDQKVIDTTEQNKKDDSAKTVKVDKSPTVKLSPKTGK